MIKENALALQEKLGYQFKDISLLEMAIDYTSREFTKFDLFEFAGDGQLQSMLGMFFIKTGYVGKAKIDVAVRTIGDRYNLARTVKDEGWVPYLNMGTFKADKNYADVFEAVLMAISLDCGEFDEDVDYIRALSLDVAPVYNLITDLFWRHWGKIEIKKDPITVLKEISEEMKINFKINIERHQNGKGFITKVVLESGEVIGSGIGPNKKESKRNACVQSLKSVELEKVIEEHNNKLVA